MSFTEINDILFVPYLNDNHYVNFTIIERHLMGTDGVFHSPLFHGFEFRISLNIRFVTICLDSKKIFKFKR